MSAKAKPSRRPLKSVQSSKRRPKVRKARSVEFINGASELNDLAKQIQTEYKIAITASIDFFDHAIKAGDSLAAAKELVGHGCWRGWLEEHVREMSERTASNYMRLAKHRRELDMLREDQQATADLTIEGALKMLRKPRKEKKEAQDEFETEEGGSTNGATNHDIELEDMREEFEQCAKRLAQKISEEDFRKLVNEICQEVYDKEKFQPHVTGTIALNEDGDQRDKK